MKRLLQRIDDGRFYQGSGSYTRDAMDAFEFPDVKSAVERCIHEGIPAYYVFKFGDESYDVRIPCACAQHPPENQKAPPANDALKTLAPEDAAEETYWGHSFNASGMRMNNQGQGQDNGEASGTTPAYSDQTRR